MVTVKTFLIAGFISMLVAGGTAAAVVTSDDLINSASEYDGKEVIYTGEVIGDIMRRGDNCWINVSDGNNAIGIWLPLKETEMIKYTGQYRYRGDIVKVKGIFNRACSEHGGDLDIHTDSLEILESGYETKRDMNIFSIIAGIILFCIALTLNLIIFKKKI